MGCKKDWHEDEDVGDCVPDDPTPYQMVAGKNGVVWFWNPDTTAWVKALDAGGGGSTRSGSDVVYARRAADSSRIDRDFL